MTIHINSLMTNSECKGPVANGEPEYGNLNENFKKIGICCGLCPCLAFAVESPVCCTEVLSVSRCRFTVPDTV